MPSLFVPLCVTRGTNGIFLKQLCGRNELSVEGTDTKSALNLLETLLIYVDGNGSTKSIEAEKIPTADRDRIIANLYISSFGQKVESTLFCKNCKNQYDLDFSLSELLNHYQPDPELLSDDGTFLIDSDSAYRLPTGEDELLLVGLSSADAEDLLMSRCLVKGEQKEDSLTIQKKMSAIAPVLNVTMQCNCPECGQEQQVQFDIQSFLLTKIKQERSQLIREIHYIASQYHWTQETILELPRNLRKQYVSCILSGN